MTFQPTVEYIKFLKIVTVGLFMAAIPLFLITTNVRLLINAPVVYSYGFDKHNIPRRTGIARDELLSAGRQIRDYFSNGEEYLTVSVVRLGQPVPGLYNSREVLHMKDVKFLVKGVYRLQEISGTYLLLFAAMGLWFRRRSFLPQLGYYGVLGAAITLAVVALAGLASIVGFDQVFLAFHQIIFTNDLWQLDPRTDMLLIMFPQGFFLDATLWIAGSTILEALIVVTASAALTGKERRGSALSAVRRLVGVAGPEPTGLA